MLNICLISVNTQKCLEPLQKLRQQLIMGKYSISVSVHSTADGETTLKMEAWCSLVRSGVKVATKHQISQMKYDHFEISSEFVKRKLWCIITVSHSWILAVFFLFFPSWSSHNQYFCTIYVLWTIKVEYFLHFIFSDLFFLYFLFPFIFFVNIILWPTNSTLTAHQGAMANTWGATHVSFLL